MPHSRFLREEMAKVGEGGSKSGEGVSDSGRPSSSASNDPSMYLLPMIH